MRQKNDHFKIRSAGPKTPADNEYARIYNYGIKAKMYVEHRNYCKKYCFLVDMRIASGKKRFFLYDLVKDSVTASGMVTHGCGSETGTPNLKFSNTCSSLATSLGKYRIGQEYHGTYGLAFKLYGLDSSNSNAYRRAVVLHAHPLVPADETWPQNICTSWGCPTVNPYFLLLLKKYIDHAGEPVLLWVVY